MEWLKLDYEEPPDEEDVFDFRWEEMPETLVSVLMESHLLETEDEALILFLEWQGFEVEKEDGAFLVSKGWRQKCMTRERVCHLLIFSIRGVFV